MRAPRASAGEFYDPIEIGSCCCNMIVACERSRDFDRAGQWCERLAAFSDRTWQRPLLALCRAHHGTVLMMRGEWAQAERDLEWAAGRAVDAAAATRRLRAGSVRAVSEFPNGRAKLSAVTPRVDTTERSG